LAQLGHCRDDFDRLWRSRSPRNGLREAEVFDGARIARRFLDLDGGRRARADRLGRGAGRGALSAQPVLAPLLAAAPTPVTAAARLRDDAVLAAGLAPRCGSGAGSRTGSHARTALVLVCSRSRSALRGAAALPRPETRSSQPSSGFSSATQLSTSMFKPFGAERRLVETRPTNSAIGTIVEEDVSRYGSLHLRAFFGLRETCAV
jgi:hypothetical protein